MKYKNISGFSILVLCVLHFQSYSSESLAAPQAKSQNKAEDFLFTHFGCSPIMRSFPRDLQYLLVQRLKELIVGKIELGKAYRETRPLPLSEDKPTAQESLLSFGASLVNRVVPGTFEELPPHLSSDINDVVFTSDETHVVCAATLIHFVVNIQSNKPDRHALATFVEYVDFWHKPKPFYETDWMRDKEKFSWSPWWDGLYYEDKSDKSGQGVKPVKFTCGLPLHLYQELSRLQGKPFWERRGDLLRLMKEYPIDRVRRASDNAFQIGVGPLEVPFVTLSDDLIGKYRHLEDLQNYPSENIRFPEFPGAATVKDSTLLFCRFLEAPPQDHPHYKLITLYGFNKIGKEYRSAVSLNNRFLLLTIREHKAPEPDDVDTWELKERLEYKITNHFHVWDMHSGECLQKFAVKGCITYATVCPNGRFALLLCEGFQGDIEQRFGRKCHESHSIVLLYHIPSALIVGYQRRGTCKGAFSGSGKLFVTVDTATDQSDINPSTHHTLRIWKLEQFINLEKLYKGQVLIEHALFILLLRELKSKGINLSRALPELARAGGVEEAGLRIYLKELYRSLPESLQTYLIKLMGS